MLVNHSFARRVRLGRLFRRADDRMLVVPLDHTVTDGPVIGGTLESVVGTLAGNGVDAVVLHKGGVRHVSPHWFAGMSLIVHLSASTIHAPNPNAKFLVSTVEEALRIGADAVSVHVNLGCDDEREQIADLAVVGDACDRWNLPLLAMIYPRGPQIENPRDPELVAHAASLAADLGADVVKTLYVGGVAEMRDIVNASPIPLITAGGPKLADPSAVVAHVADVLRAGAAGVAMGRNIFNAADPGAMARQVSALIHSDSRPSPLRELDQLEVAAG